ncbi:MAG: outer membrane beta-barrel family protein [Bacteroidota bacterium]
MKYFFTTLAVILCCVHYGSGQSFSVAGSVMDTLNSNPLHRASIVLIRAKDTVIEAHGRTSPGGTFSVPVSTAGKYMLRVTFPGFADYVDMLDVKNDMNLGMLPMISKSHLLQEYVVKQQVAAIKIKGDTTEYMADSFRVKENATVEDLLKKLPGIQVDKDGKITAQGETVQKILVDGEEFFSDDPKVVSKGLQANAVSTVQVFDKKSEQAAFTGIDDGEKTKTINLQLKDDKKKGFFGKIDAGAGTDGYFQEQGMINAFKAKRQLSAFGIASNTDKAGLGWEDNNKFGSGNGVTEITDDGGIMTYYNGGDDDFSGWGGQYNGEGLPKTWTGGVHYADKWNQEKQKLGGNYRYAKQNVELDGATMIQRILSDDSSNVNDQRKNQFSQNERHSADLQYEGKIDSNTTIRVSVNAGTKHSDIATRYHTETYIKKLESSGDTLYNDRTIVSMANATFINADAILRKKFAKKGRTLSVDVKENYKDSKSDGILLSTFYDELGSVPTPQINQKKINNTNTLSFSSKATYTEPLSKVVFADLNYGVTVNNSISENKSYEGAGYTALNDTFSSDYKYNILTNSGGLNFKFVFKKATFSFGSDVSHAAFVQTDRLHGDTTTTYNFTNLFPKGNLNYKIGKQTSFNLQYNGSTQQPTISQIQPLRQNTDPLNITIGNPNLKQAFTNRISVRFNDYKVLSGRYLWTSFTLNTTSNAITTEQNTAGGINTTRFINLDGGYNGWGYMGYGFKLKKLNTQLGLQLNGSTSRTNNIINGKLNTSDFSTISLTPRIDYELEDKIEISIDPTFSYNINKSTVSDVNANYWTFNPEASVDVELPKKVEIGTSVDISIREQTNVFTGNNNVVKWNAYVTKKFMKKDQLELKLSVYDILNQNLGFSRNAQPNLITQNTYNTIRRYGMLSLIWNFTYNPAGAAPAAENNTTIIK